MNFILSSVAQWAKILKKMQFREDILFASKAKINFFEKFLNGAVLKVPEE